LTARTAPLCILGIHRSGTSTVTRALNIAGLYLGEERDLMPPHPQNPEGFWERLDIQIFHDDLLGVMGRQWDTTEFLPPHWLMMEEIDSFRGRLARLVENAFDGHPLWGWKDPRTSLLLPIWQEVLARQGVSPRYLLVLRNPLDVARSLARRDGFPLQKGFRIWFVNMVSALSAVGSAPVTIVDYDRFMAEPFPTLRRLLGELSIDSPYPEETVRGELSRFIRHDLRHSQSTLGDLLQAGAPDLLVDLYRRLNDRSLLPGPHQLDDLGDIFERRGEYPPIASTVRCTISLALFNNLHLTQECLSRLFDTTEPASYELIISDNGSTDGTPRFLEEIERKTPPVRVIRHPFNTGFIRAHNRALQEARGEYFVVLNNDLFIREKGWLDRLLAPMERDPRVKLTGFAGGGNSLSPDGVGGVTSEVVEYVEGKCLAVPTEFARTVGLFGEEFDLAYCEDVDLSLRVRQMGFSVELVEIGHHHVGNGTAAILDPVRLTRVRTLNHDLIRRKWGRYLSHRRFSGRVLVEITTPRLVDHLAATVVIERLHRAAPFTAIDVVCRMPEVFTGNPAVTRCLSPLEEIDREGYDRIIPLDPEQGSAHEPLVIRLARQACVMPVRLAPFVYCSGGGSQRGETSGVTFVSRRLSFDMRARIHADLERRGERVVTVEPLGEGGAVMREGERNLSFMETVGRLVSGMMYIGPVDDLLCLAQGVMERVVAVIDSGDDPFVQGVDRGRCVCVTPRDEVPYDGPFPPPNGAALQRDLIESVMRYGELEGGYVTLLKSSNEERSRLLDEVIQRTSELVLLKNSLTWRMTAPLRKVIDRVRHAARPRDDRGEPKEV